MNKNQDQFFRSRWTLVLAALGMAIGTGNIWRFPRVVAINGGGSFLIPWAILLFTWSIPLLILELAIGKKTRSGPIRSIAFLMGENYVWMGCFISCTTVAIMSYYSVVTGWCINYFLHAIGTLIGFTSQIQSGKQAWSTFSSHSYLPLAFHLIAISVAAWVVSRGLRRGIELANMILIPTLFIIIILCAGAALTLPNAKEGLEFLFTIKGGELWNYKTWLEALSQSAFSTGAGWGLLLVYGVYARQDEKVVSNAVITGIGNNLASLFVALAIFPTLFSLLSVTAAREVLFEPGPASTGIAFIVMPELLAQLPLGRMFTFLFFTALVFASFSSLIAMVELGTRTLMDLKLARKKSVLIVWAVGLLLGVPSALKISFLENQDWVWGIGLIVSGAFIAIAAVKYGFGKFEESLLDWHIEAAEKGIVKWWHEIIYHVLYLPAYFLIPLEFAALMVWWFTQSIRWYPHTWWNPLQTYTLGTCLVQWGLVLLIAFILRKKIGALVSKGLGVRG